MNAVTMASASNSSIHSSVPGFMLMLQYLLHQQQNIPDNKCKKHVERLKEMHEERQKYEREKEMIKATLAAQQEKYMALEMKLKAIERSLHNRVGDLQKCPQNSCFCNSTDLVENSNSVMNQSEPSGSSSLEKLQKFFEVFFKKKNAECSKNRTLLVATRMNNSEVAAAIVNAGANINTEDASSWERTPLHWAAVLNHIEIARILLNSGANVEPRETGVYSMYTPLHEAAKYGHIMMCALLLDAHADKNSRDKDGSTPLHTAARNGHLELVKFFVDRGFAITAQDKWGDTPKDRARKYRHNEVANWLAQSEFQSRLKTYKDTR